MSRRRSRRPVAVPRVIDSGQMSPRVALERTDCSILCGMPREEISPSLVLPHTGVEICCVNGLRQDPEIRIRGLKEVGRFCR